MPYETGPTDTDPLTPQVLPVPVFLTQKGHVDSFFFFDSTGYIFENTRLHFSALLPTFSLISVAVAKLRQSLSSRQLRSSIRGCAKKR